MTQLMPAQVREVFELMPAPQREALLEIRAVILDVARLSDDVGPLVETLKWSQPAYLTEQSRSGTTVRLAPFGASDIAILVHCQTTLIDDFRGLYPHLTFDKTRAVVFSLDHQIPVDPVRRFVSMALAYRLRATPFSQ